MEYWYNIRTGKVEEGQQSQGKELMGPYSTRAEAEAALTTAAERTEAWDEADDEWEDNDGWDR